MRPTTILIIVLVVILAAVGGFFAAQQFASPQEIAVTEVVQGEGFSPSQVEATVSVRLTQSAIANTDTEATPEVTQNFIRAYVAKVDIPRGVTINPDMIEEIPAPEEYVPLRAIEDPDAIIGRIARTDIAREQVILSSLLVEDLSQLAAGGSDAAAVLPPGRVAIALPIDAITSVAYALQPGDSVDVIVSMLFVDVDIDFQSIQPNNVHPISVILTVDENGGSGVTYSVEEATAGDFDTRTASVQLPNSGGASPLTIPVVVSPAEPQRPRLVTQRTVIDAMVVYLGEFPRDGRIFREEPLETEAPEIIIPAEGFSVEATPVGTPTNTPQPPRPQIVTLAVRPQDAVTLTYMAEAGLPMTFALRSARDQTLPPTEPVTLDYIMRTFNIPFPERFQFAVEPAIRSIRELSLGERIELNPEPNSDPATEAEGGN